jgi:hypothetical protein
MLISPAHPLTLGADFAATCVGAGAWPSGAALDGKRTFVSLNQALRRNPCRLE